MNPVKIFSALILITGEVFICQPSFLFHSDSSASPEDTSNYVLGVGLALVASVSGSLDAIFVNMLKSEVSLTL